MIAANLAWASSEVRCGEVDALAARFVRDSLKADFAIRHDIDTSELPREPLALRFFNQQLVQVRKDIAGRFCKVSGVNAMTDFDACK